MADRGADVIAVDDDAPGPGGDAGPDPGPGDGPADVPSVPAGAVRGRRWHLVAVSAVVGVLAAFGTLAVVVALSDPSEAGRATWTAAAALSVGIAGSIVAMLAAH